jgi:hypothetical protein
MSPRLRANAGSFRIAATFSGLSRFSAEFFGVSGGFWFDPSTHPAELEKLIQDKIEHGDKAMPAPRRKTPASNIIDLVSVLQQSLQETEARAKSCSTETRGSRKKTRSAARSRRKVA